MKAMDGVGMGVAALAVALGAGLAGFAGGAAMRVQPNSMRHKQPEEQPIAAGPDTSATPREAMLHVIALGNRTRGMGRLSEQFGDVLVVGRADMPTLNAFVAEPVRATRDVGDAAGVVQWWYSIQVEILQGIPAGILAVELLRANGDSAGVMCWDLGKSGGGIYGGWANVPPIGADAGPYSVDRLTISLLGMGEYQPDPTIGHVPLQWVDADAGLEWMGYATP